LAAGGFCTMSSAVARASKTASKRAGLMLAAATTERPPTLVGLPPAD
jgi:hypothetical protein